MTMNPAVVDVPLRYCRRCEVERPSSECRAVTAGSGTLMVCPACGMVTREVVRKTERPFLDVLLEAAAWPAKGDNRITWAAFGLGVVLFGKVPLFGGFLSAGILWSYLFLVIQRGARGEEEAPVMSDFRNWWSVAVPLLRGAATLLIPLLPLALSLLYVDGLLKGPAAFLSLLWALGMLPASVASVAYDESFVRAVDPRPMVALVTRIPRAYLTTVGVLGLLTLGWLATWWFRYRVTGALLPFWVVPAFAIGVVCDAAMVFFPMAMARVMAVMLREHAELLGIEPLPALSRLAR